MAGRRVARQSRLQRRQRNASSDNLPLTKSRQAFNMWHKLDVSSFTVAVYFYDIAAMRKTTNSKLSQYVGTALF